MALGGVEDFLHEGVGAKRDYYAWVGGDGRLDYWELLEQLFVLGLVLFALVGELESVVWLAGWHDACE